MRILVIGAGGVGTAAVAIAARRGFFEHMVVADYDPARVEHALAQVAGDARFSGARADAGNVDAMVALIREHGITHVLNAVDPRFVMPIFDACYQAGVDYMDMAMSLSRPHPEQAVRAPGREAGRPPVRDGRPLGGRRPPGLRGHGGGAGPLRHLRPLRADELFSEIDEAGVRDGANLVVDGYDFAPGFSIWTTIEECLNPPVVWEADRGWFTLPPFSEPEVFDFPGGIGPVECVHVEHEEVLLIPRWVKVKRATFKYGLGNEFINVLQVLHKLGLDKTAPVTVKGVQVSPRDVVAACLPDPAGLGDRMHGQDLRRTLGHGQGQGRPAAAGLPVPRGGQRLDLAGVRLAGRGLADGDQPRRGVRAAGPRHVVRHRRPGPGGIRAQAVPGPAGGVRVAVGDARGGGSGPVGICQEHQPPGPIRPSGQIPSIRRGERRGP